MDISDLDACAVSDAMDAMGLNGAVTGLARLATKTRIAGRVRTVLLDAMRNEREGIRHLATAAVESAEANEILVVSQRTNIDAAGWGGVLSNAAVLRGIQGVIVDGPVRDVDEAEGLQFPVFARSSTVRTARGRVFEQAYNIPIELAGGVVVTPGDFVIADASGVVFVPAEKLDAVMAIALRIARKERLMTSAIRNGQAVSAVMGANYEQMLDKEGLKNND